MRHSQLQILPKRQQAWNRHGEWLDVEIWGSSCGIRVIQQLSETPPNSHDSCKHSKGMAICVLNVPANIELSELLSRLSDRRLWLFGLLVVHIITEPDGQTSRCTSSALFHFNNSTAAHAFAVALSQIATSQLPEAMESKLIRQEFSRDMPVNHTSVSTGQQLDYTLGLLRTLEVDASPWILSQSCSVDDESRRVLSHTPSSNWTDAGHCCGSCIIKLEDNDKIPTLWSLAARASKVRELPNCATCLDRLDCFESMHWCRDAAAVRMSNTLRSLSSSHSSLTQCQSCLMLSLDSDAHLQCASCGDSGALWVCLVCGHVGCGRYSNEHAKTHYHLSGHTLSIEIATQRIWDYAQDGYVHHLRTSSRHLDLRGSCLATPPSDKRLEFAHACRATALALGGDAELPTAAEDKLSELALHYEGILEAQLATQRLHYEQLAKATEAGDDVLKAHSQKIDASSADVAALQALCAQAESKIQASKRRFETLVMNTDAARAAATATLAETHLTRDVYGRRRVSDLQSQIRDLEVCLKTRKDVAGESTVGATVVVPPLAPVGSTRSNTASTR